MKVFLSHAEKDEKVAHAVRAELTKAGFDVWDPAKQVTPGDNWALELGRALKAAEAMVILLSPAALASPHVQREMEYALSDERFRGRLLPVVVRPVRDIPWILEKLPVGVVRMESDPEHGGRQIVQALKRMQTAA